MATAAERKSRLIAGNWDVIVIVIGSGIGGLTTAAALAKHGWKVAVLEQHYVIGGCTHMFSRKGRSWDVGVHCVGQMQETDLPGKVLKWLSDGKMQMNPLVGMYDQVFLPGGFHMEVPDSKEKFRAQLKGLFPQDTQAIDRYFELVLAAADGAKYYFASRMLPTWLSGMVAKLGRDWWTRTTHEVLSELTSNEKLRVILTSQWGYYGATPKESSFAIHAITVRHFWDGGFYPVGGAKSYADHLVPTIQAAGGDVFTRTSVKEILVEGGRARGVKLDSGEELRAPRVISAAGARATAERLLPESESQASWASEIRGLKQSRAYVTLYLGFEGDIESSGATKANHWHFESWDMEKAEWDVADPKSESPFLYISFPSLKDPEHQGSTHTGEIVTFVPWTPFEQWKHTRRGFREKEYAEFKKSIEERLFAQAKKHLPELMEKVKFMELSTPLSTEFFIRAPQGAIYGLHPDPKRFTSQALRTRTPIDGLYLSGCDVAALGIAGALTGGLLTAATLEPRLIPRLF